MKLFKARKNPKFYITKSEIAFCQNAIDLIGEVYIEEINKYDENLKKQGLSITKELHKQGIDSIQFGYSTWGNINGITCNKIELVDILSFCELLILNDKSFFCSHDGYEFIGHSRYVNLEQKVNFLLQRDLDGMYEFVDGILIETEHVTLIKNTELTSTEKEKILKFFNPYISHSDKKGILRDIATELESKGIKNLDNNDLFNRQINKLNTDFKDIVNRLDGVRHSSKETVTYDEVKEYQLMKLAITKAMHYFEHINQQEKR